jgi:formylglycine-generating enzyme required for sulfatase activity
VTEALLNHPSDEALSAMSLGRLAEAELAQVSAHLTDCPACCRRIDQLATDDRLLACVQKGAASREKAMVGPAQRRAAVRALGQLHEARSVTRVQDPQVGTVPEIANASAVQTHRDAPPSKGLSNDLTSFLAPPERPDEIGRLGPYRILAVLAHGGMGVVFRAHDPALDRLVALKAMLPGVAVAPNARERFLREARAAAALKHPRVVTIFQVGEDRGAPFLAMEFLEGEPLDDRLRREGRLPLAEVLRIGREIALALAAAHARGLVHRDIKPANLWLEGPTGHVKVLDFGLAWAQATQAHLTQSGLIVGTPAYMAPEQAEGKPADPRCDLFSLGCVLYQMNTGSLPFHGESTIAVLRALALHEPPPVRELRPEAPPELSALVARLLAKKPEDRPASAQEVAETLRALEQLATAQILPKPGARRARPSRKPLVAVAGAALAVALAVALIVVLWPTPRGTVRIESDDPAVEVVFGKDGPTIKGADKEPITLRAGEHGVLIKRGDFTFETDKLVLKKGAALTLKVELLRGKVQVMQNGKVVATQDMPLPARYTNTIGIEFVRVPKGKSWLGGEKGQPGDNEVEIKEDFYLGKYEVTQEEWAKVMGTTPSHFSPTGAGKDAVKDIPEAELKRFPVEMVSWDDAQVFLRLLNQRDRHEGWVYRMPTEVEWEYACRGGPMADRPDGAFDYYFDRPMAQLQPKQANHIEPGLNRTCKVGSYPPNKLGLCDMHGNVWEWCADAEKRDDAVLHVYRGGGWNWHYGCRATARLTHDQTARSDHLGLRLARVRALVGPVLQDGQAPPAATQDMPRPAVVPDEAWVKKVQAMAPEDQEKEVAAKLKELNPGFDGRLVRRIEEVGPRLDLATDQVTNFTPLRALTGVSVLSCPGSGTGKGHMPDPDTMRAMRLIGLHCEWTNVADLAPLAGMKLIYLDCSRTTVTDLEPLREMPMQYLYFQECQGIKSLAPLEGMPLKHFDCAGTRVADLAPLRGMKLKCFWVASTPVRDLEPLRGMPLEILDFRSTQVEDLAPLEGMKLTELHCEKSRVTDLSILRGMPLKKLSCDFRAERDAAILRSIKTLEKINGKSAAEFWKEVDAKARAQQP